MTMRIGQGLDAHRLVDSRPLVLGCVEVAHDRGLAGHSDGDVAAHALCDALLGAAGLGDMGRHFPSTDPRWEGATGAGFLEAVAGMLTAAGLRPSSAHVVIVAEQPRLADHLAAMATACAAALGIDGGRVGFAATTSDGMGFAGRGEGIAASAVALLEEI